MRMVIVAALAMTTSVAAADDTETLFTGKPRLSGRDSELPRGGMPGRSNKAMSEPVSRSISRACPSSGKALVTLVDYHLAMRISRALIQVPT